MTRRRRSSSPPSYSDPAAVERWEHSADLEEQMPCGCAILTRWRHAADYIATGWVCDAHRREGRTTPHQEHHHGPWTAQLEGFGFFLHGTARYERARGVESFARQRFVNFKTQLQTRAEGRGQAKLFDANGTCVEMFKEPRQGSAAPP